MRAFIGESDLYEVHPQFEHICIESDEWYGITKSQSRKQCEKMKVKMGMEQSALLKQPSLSLLIFLGLTVEFGGCLKVLQAIVMSSVADAPSRCMMVEMIQFNSKY